jgi:hypothetical protein
MEEPEEPDEYGAPAPGQPQTKESWAKALGVDPESEPDLFAFIAKAYDLPLPPHWEQHTDEKGRRFYWNPQGHESSWQHPLMATLRSIAAAYRRVVESEDPKAACYEEVEHFHDQGEEELRGWRQSHAADGTPYFYKKGTKLTRWDNPRDELVNQMELRVRMLSELAEMPPQRLRPPVSPMASRTSGGATSSSTPASPAKDKSPSKGSPSKDKIPSKGSPSKGTPSKERSPSRSSPSKGSPSRDPSKAGAARDLSPSPEGGVSGMPPGPSPDGASSVVSSSPDGDERGSS